MLSNTLYVALFYVYKILSFISEQLQAGSLVYISLVFFYCYFHLQTEWCINVFFQLYKKKMKFTYILLHFTQLHVFMVFTGIYLCCNSIYNVFIKYI